ncbi:hypothetical protein BRW62_01600 [Parathermosynechococcus lividus PCC 6715]|uniref:Uncharacterized protein n=1 Tax=Parathermosynechococcus lividus PCC 6715 TaxID=1917166 RepID=A0A2D2PZK4_PARLV|nr:hypothetical protein BRW62_01600 [Thermostichus lividus PCC 6715]
MGDSSREKRSNAASARCVASFGNPLSFKEGRSQFNYQTAQSLQYQQSLQNVVHWACGVLRTFGSFETSPQLRFFFAALQLDAEATLEQVAAQRAIPYLQHLATKEHGLHRT